MLDAALTQANGIVCGIEYSTSATYYKSLVAKGIIFLFANDPDEIELDNGNEGY